MNVVDILIVAVIVISVIRGLIRGFIRGLAGLAALIVGVVVAAQTYPWLADSAFFAIPGSHGPEIVGFIVAFLIVALLISWVGRLISKVVKLASLGWVDHLAGGGLGFVKGCIIVGVVLLLAVMAGLEDSRSLAESELAPVVFTVTDWIVAMIPEDARAKFESSYQKLRGRWERARREDRAELVSAYLGARYWVQEPEVTSG
jgi:membrane protein required for colicin V production